MHRLKLIPKLAGALSASSDCLQCRSLATLARRGRGRGNLGQRDGDIERSRNRQEDEGSKAFVERFLQDDKNRSEAGSVRRADPSRSSLNGRYDEDEDEDEDEMLSEAKGQALDLSSAEDGDTEDDFDEEERQAISNMDNEEFEKHLRHREHSKALKEAIPMDRTGEQVGKLQDVIPKNWRSHDDISSRLAPSEEERHPKRHPQQSTMEKLAKDYNIDKARVHAMLWNQEMRKQRGEVGSPDHKEEINLAGKPHLPPLMGEGGYTEPNYKAMPEDWEGSVQADTENTSAKEEAMMLREFERRMEHNRRQIANFVKQHLYSRRRPVEGWNYVVESFDSETRRGKIGAYRYVPTSDGKHGKPNELDKLTLKRESIRPRQ